MWTSENNWYSWSYGDLEPFSRQSLNLSFKTNFSKFNGTVGTFKEELINAAKSSMDHVEGKLTILFSGGLDSEIMLRSFLEIGAVPNVIIVRYENDYNIYDVSYAVTICSILNIDYKIIDFNLNTFFENDAERCSDLAQIDRPRALPYCGILEKIDEYVILGASDLSPIRTHDDYTTSGTWVNRCWEHDIGWSKFIRKINKPGIAEWFKWTPGLVLSYLNLKWFNNLINDKYYGKLGSKSTKIIGYREAYPDLLYRKKQTGFEKIDSLVLEFEKFLKQKNKGLIFRNFHDRKIDQLIKEIRG